MVAFFVLYVVGHFALYVLCLRHQTVFRREVVIFTYHVVPYVLWVALGMFLWYSGAANATDSIETITAIAAGHGIYSLSFLELWSLSQGGYSLSILDEVDRAERIDQSPDWNRLALIGDKKQSDRLKALLGLGLIRSDDAGYRLTGLGMVVALALALLVWTANLKDTG